MAVNYIYGKEENMYWDVTHFRYTTLLSKTLYIWAKRRLRRHQNTVVKIFFFHFINHNIATIY